MKTIICAEALKYKHTFGRNIVLLAPVLTIMIAFGLTLGMEDAWIQSVWNWWYVMLLPGMLVIICDRSMRKEKKNRYFHFKTLAQSGKKLMFGKILYIAFLLLIANVIIFLGVVLGSKCMTTSVPFGGDIVATILLAVTLLWEIPLFLFVSQKFGLIVDVLVCMFLSGFGVVVASTKWWWLVPSAIPSRIVCPFVHVMPNGLPVEEGSVFLNHGVVVPGIFISVGWLVLLTFLYLKWFEEAEVR